MYKRSESIYVVLSRLSAELSASRETEAAWPLWGFGDAIEQVAKSFY